MTNPIPVEITNPPANKLSIKITPQNDVAKEQTLHPGQSATVNMYEGSDIIIADAGFYGEAVTDTPPTTVADIAETEFNTPVVVDVLANDIAGLNPIDPTSVVLMDGSVETSALVVTDEGTYTVDEDTGEVTFTPDALFEGEATPVSYKVSSTTGKKSTAATITVTVAPETP